MTPSPRPPNVLAYLRSALGPESDGASDAALLARFAVARDDSAFELLVWRHSAMVLRVSGGILHDQQAAEDICQATFLALARQAASVGRRGSVAGWLFRVARRLAVRLAARRQKRPDVQINDLDRLPAANQGQEPSVDADTVRLLHEELDRLPDKYRAPVLLCFFDGLSYADAANRLGWPVGTVAGRVARAKDRLQYRLSRRGVAIPAIGLAALFVSDATSSASPSFMRGLAQAARAFADGAATIPGISDNMLLLAKGAVRPMTISKLQLAIAGFAISSLLAFGGIWVAAQQRPATDAKPDQPLAEIPKPDKTPPAERKADLAQRNRSLNNLKKIVLGMHLYLDATGHLPGDIRDKDGKALLSWRVALLPYLEQKELFKQFKLDEPWDSDRNKKLLAKMPTIYRVGFEPANSRDTYYQTFAGVGTPWGTRATTDGGSGGSASGPGGPLPPRNPYQFGLADITDGTSNTFAVVEAGPPVPWTKPADIPYDSKKPLPKLVGPFSNGLHVSMIDGRAFAIRRDMNPTGFRRFIEMNDGYPMPNLKEYRASFPAETAKEKAELQKQLAENQKLIEELERQMKAQIELLSRHNTGIRDTDVAGDEAEKLQEILKDYKRMNEKLRMTILRESLPKPKEKEPHQ